MGTREPMFVTRYANRDQARRKFGSLADDFATFYVASDPQADELVEFLVAEGKHGKALFEQALAHGIGAVGSAPAPLTTFFHDIEHVPPWVDINLMNTGARAFQRLGPAGLLILGSWSLLNGYHSAPAVKPLAFTGALTKNAARRLAETGQFVSRVTQVDGLRVGAPGYQLTARVRVVHARVRYACRRSPGWREQDWGVPINQADMLGTILEFSWMVVEGARKLGFRFSQREVEGIFMLWRYCAYLNGVAPALLQHLESEASARRIAELMHDIQPGPDEDSRELTRALLAVHSQHARTVTQRMLARVIAHYHTGMARAFNGKVMSDQLGLPDTSWKYSLYPTRAIVGVMEAARCRIPGATRLAALVGNHVVQRDIAAQLAH